MGCDKRFFILLQYIAYICKTLIGKMGHVDENIIFYECVDGSSAQRRQSAARVMRAAESVASVPDQSAQFHARARHFLYVLLPSLRHCGILHGEYGKRAARSKPRGKLPKERRLAAEMRHVRPTVFGKDGERL